MNKIKILQSSLLAGSLYFLSISLAHITGVKIPGLFIFYDVESYQYQDSIISFLAFGWSAFFYAGSKHLEIITPVLLSSLVALVALAHITSSTNFSDINQTATSTSAYWVQITLLFVYVGWLWVFAIKSGVILLKGKNP